MSEPFKIFLASPGDVPLERKLAREAITHIQSGRIFRGKIDIEIIAWDQPGAAVAMEAGLTPQDAIAQGLPKPEDCDLAVIILWSRIGTQLPIDFELKEDGSAYLSGTEWEYLNALKGFKSKNKPAAVWVYRRHGAPQFSADDPELPTKLDQWRKLENFFNIFTNPDGSLAGGINHYESPDDFRKQFEDHLRDQLEKRLETMPVTDTSDTDDKDRIPTIWNDSPYPGLEAFSPEQAPIYFGRGQEVDQLLQHFASQKVNFVAVVGISGSGKSSLVKAGLLPRLRNGIVGNTPWIDLVFKPGERGANPYLALAYVLKAKLNLSGITEQELAREMQNDYKEAQQQLANLLAQHKAVGSLLLVVDQFEELFTQCNPNESNNFFELLNHIVAQPKIRIIITLRADFYARAIEEPVLAKLLRRDRGTFPLDPPGLSAILQMITRPAEAAGVELEDGLAQRLLDDAGNGPGAMALIAFTLSQLYQQQKDSDKLTIDGYEAIGGVWGAVQKRAETALNGLSVDSDKSLPVLFSHLVEVNEQEVATRRRAVQSKLKGGAEILAKALIEARLLVTGVGEDQQPTVEVAHETVLTGWQQLNLWISDHANSLRARRDLERVASEWNNSGRHGSALRGGKLLGKYLEAAEPRSPTATEYLTVCKRRQAWIRVKYAATLGLGLSLFLIAQLVPKTPNQSYRNDLSICRYTGPGDCHESALQEYRPESNEGYQLGFVEYSDQGQLRDRAQMQAVLDHYYKIASDNDVLLIVFAHGWHHSAQPGDASIASFRQLLSKVAKSENDSSESQKRSKRKVLGLYIGWRGASINVPAIKEVSFWDRKNAANNIGQRGVSELLLKVEELVNVKAGMVEDVPKPLNSRLVVIGHSFGGALIYTALQQVLVDRFVDGRKSKTYSGDAGGFGDLVILINPVFEASLFAASYDISQQNCRRFFSSQPPRLAILTSEADYATKYAFSVGRFFSTLFESSITRTSHYCSELDKSGIQPLIIDTAETARIAVGHYQPFLTHTLKPASNQNTQQRNLPVENIQKMWSSNRNDEPIRFTQSSLFSLDRTMPRNPYLNIKVDKTLINNHNDIWRPEIISFVSELIEISTKPIY